MRYPKVIFILSLIILTANKGHAQEPSDSFDSLWEKVNELEGKDLTESARKVVKLISGKAEEEDNSEQFVKALLHTSKYALILEEDAQLAVIKDFRTEIAKTEFPTKNILQSYLANLYWQYFLQNRYQFYDRTRTENKVDTTDFRTWDLNTLFHEIGIHFDASLENKDALQNIGLDQFREILSRGADSKSLRPSLFDLLAHTALDFYRRDENSITRPTTKFEIDNPELFSEAYAFTQQKIDTQDRTSLQAKALKIYQDLVEFHYSDAEPSALVHVDIERLKFIYQNAVFSEKDNRYLKVLRSSAENWERHEVSALYTYEIAQLHHNQGNGYDPKKGQENRWKQKEALALCNSAITRFPESRGAEQCQALKSRILSTSLELTVETNLPAQQEARILVNYKNISGLEMNALRATPEELKKLEGLYPQSEQLAFLEKLPVTKKWEAELKNEGDYQRHGMEVLLPALENGHYVILASPIKKNKAAMEKEPSPSQADLPGQGTFAFSPIQVTDIALVTTRTPDSYRFQVTERHNGHPISGAEVQLSYRKNYSSPYLKKSFSTGKMGLIEVSPSQDNWSDVTVEVRHKTQKARFGPYYISRGYERDNRQRVRNSAFLFTDRSIYRPAQPLYFKGIVIENYEGLSKVAAEENVFVTLFDANGQEVSQQDFATNEFGSFSGEFVLPNNGLTGEYHLEARGTSGIFRQRSYFSVEEYKRPKFETVFDSINETYRVNDSIKVKGSAQAYAGSPITEALVSYRVKRVVFFPRWYYWSRSHPYFKETPQEIARGETRTDASGLYEIDFKALPDNGIPKEDLPTFRYEVTADVTDINGETRTATTIVSVGYHALTANIDVPDRLDKDSSTDTLNVTTKNLNGRSVATTGTLKMYKLQAPERVLRNRPWEAPDYQNWDKAKFKELFPHDALADEDDSANWGKGSLVWETEFDTGKSGAIPLELSKKWASGKYVVELETKDRFGQQVQAFAKTSLFSDEDKRPVDNRLFQIATDKESYTIGDNVEIKLASAAKDLNVTVSVEKAGKTVDTRIIALKNDTKSFSVPVTGEDMGGFAVNYHFTAFNSFESGSVAIPVPYPKTDLNIETVSFRDKLQPGTDETWAFKIKGPKGEKVSAELLASMYDASLDAFRGHAWTFSPLLKPTYNAQSYTEAHQSFGVTPFRVYLDNAITSFTPPRYNSLEWFGFSFQRLGVSLSPRSANISIRGAAVPMENARMEMAADGVALNEVVTTGYGDERRKPQVSGESEEMEEKESDEGNGGADGKDGVLKSVQIRKNLQETAFFFPKLRTDASGNLSFGFTSPEALTQWKLQLLAHTKNLESSVKTLETVTQKELMVIPNAPRFLREGDQITISTKIANLTDKRLSGQARLELVDAVTGAEISQKILIEPSDEGEASGSERASGLNNQNFTVDSLGNTQVSWYLKISDGLQAVQYKVLAKAGSFSDGEQNLLPVLTNRMLVTETLPMWVRSDQRTTFVLDKLKEQPDAKAEQDKSTLKHHKLSLEITSNPAWYAVQALPYLMEYPYDCNEQTFARYYANALASYIANSNPRIQEVFRQWASSDALISNLEKNQELKSLLIQETPWLRDARSETEQKKRIALLFNLEKMKNEQANALAKLANNQKPSGAWSWFQGGPDNRYITQHILTGLGHLRKLTDSNTSGEKASQDKASGQDKPTRIIIQNAMEYLDAAFVQEYENMKKYASNLNKDHLSAMQINYLYMRSFFPEMKTSKKVDEIEAYYKGQARKYWANKSLYLKGMLALTLNRSGDSKTANNILRALKENSITSDELGMYWKENKASWYWHQAPIETQALMIEAFGEIRPGDEQTTLQTMDNLKIWLLKNKQVNQWDTTKSTTEAVYALLLQGSDWLSVSDAVDVLVGGEKIDPAKLDGIRPEAGTGYFKTSWNTSEIHPDMAEVRLDKKGEGIAWGALYWQYFEDLDKITSAETPLKLQKKLFLKKNSDTGEKLFEIDETSLRGRNDVDGSENRVKVGDIVRVRIELRADRDMEFVHMKDMRAAGFEPVNVLSRYKWQDGLGYYESTKDASTNFFFDYLPKGVYVFEYDLRVNNAGEFSNGITTIQSMYAPEFSSHSEGTRVKVAN